MNQELPPDGMSSLVNAETATKVDVVQSVAGSVSGTVTANQGTPNTAANAWPVKVTDGTDTADVTAASALKVDGSAVTQPVSGSVTSTQGTAAAISAPWPVLPAGASNSGQTFAAISVSSSAVALPTTPLTSRRLIIIANVHTTLNLNIGPTSGVTGGAAGLYSFRLVPEESRIIPADSSVTWYGIRDSASAGNVNVTEFR